MNRGIRASRALAVAVAIAALIGGCGGSSGSSNPNTAALASGAIQRAAFVSNNRAGYRMQMTMQIAAGGQTINATANGSVDIHPAAGSVNVQMTIPSLSRRISFSEVIAHGTIYIKYPRSIASRLPGAKPWFSINLARQLKAEGLKPTASLVSSSSSGPTSNPGVYLRYLKLASANRVHDLGPANIDGVQTEQYGTILDLQKIPLASSGAERKALESNARVLQSLTGLRYVPMTVWIDPNRHLVRQLAMSFTEEVPSTGDTIRTFMEINFLSYGLQPVPATPPAGQVTDLTAALSRHA